MLRKIISPIPVQRFIMAATAAPEAVGPSVAGPHCQRLVPLRVGLPTEQPCREELQREKIRRVAPREQV